MNQILLKLLFLANRLRTEHRKPKLQRKKLIFWATWPEKLEYNVEVLTLSIKHNLQNSETLGRIEPTTSKLLNTWLTAWATWSTIAHLFLLELFTNSPTNLPLYFKISENSELVQKATTLFGLVWYIRFIVYLKVLWQGNSLCLILLENEHHFPHVFKKIKSTCHWFRTSW